MVCECVKGVCECVKGVCVCEYETSVCECVFYSDHGCIGTNVYV